MFVYLKQWKKQKRSGVSIFLNNLYYSRRDDFDFNGYRYFVEPFGIKDHTNCIILHHTIYFGFFVLMSKITSANDTDSK